MYNEKYPKAKIKSYNGKINTNFYNDKIPKEDSQFICLSVILIDSVFRTSKNYYPQLFLEECKYVIKEKISEYITDNIEISSSSETEVDFSIIRFYFSFWIFFIVRRFTIKFFSDTIFNFYPNFISPTSETEDSNEENSDVENCNEKSFKEKKLSIECVWFLYLKHFE